MYILAANVTRQVRTWRILGMTRSPESGPEDCLAETEPIVSNPQVCGHGFVRRRVTLQSHRRSIFDMIAQLNVPGSQEIVIDIQGYYENSPIQSRLPI